MLDVKSAEKQLYEHEVETTTSFVMYYSYGVGKGKSNVRGASDELWLREGMLSGGMQGCRGYGETKGGGGMQKLSTVEFHKNCKLNLLFILILRDRCVVQFPKIGKNGIE